MKKVTIDEIREGLWNEDAVKYYDSSDKYKDHIMEQYKIYLEMADRISARRNLANTFFLTLHTVIIGALGITFDKLIDIEWKGLIIFPLIAVLALCFTWYRIVKTYRQINTAKYKVVGLMEERLPSSPYWSAEWKALGEGKNPDLYVPLTQIEKWVPIIFAVIYVLGALFFIL